MKRLFFLLALTIGCGFQATAQKQIYIPEDLRGMDLESDTSQWSFRRSVETRDLIFMWERGFGNDLQNPPQLDGHPMAFNLSVLTDRVQRFYDFFRDSLEFVKSEELRVKSEEFTSADTTAAANSSLFTLHSSLNSLSDRYKMMVMVMYSLDGTAYGGTYDDTIGALWVAPNRIQDHTMNCMAHELGHSFQSQIVADGQGEAWGGSGFFEMASQWMLWQVNPWWLRDENYHFEAFRQLTHKAFLHLENIYHSPYVLQWWADLHGRGVIAELFRQGRRGEDPVMTYQRMHGLTQSQFCDEMLQGYQHLVNLDFQHARQETRPYACTWQTPLDTLSGGWLRPQNVPEAYGFNIIPLPADRRLSVQVKGQNLRWALVGITPDGRSVYGQPQDARLKTKEPLSRLFLVVMGAPTRHRQLRMPTEDQPDPAGEPELFPYTFRIKH